MNSITASIATAVLADILGMLELPIFASRSIAAQKDRRDEPQSTRREAFLWMLARAVRRDGLHKGYRLSAQYALPVAFGELSQAHSEMARAWNWSEKAVRLFLDELEGAGELSKITPRDSHGRDLTAKRVPLAYRIERVARWLEQSQAGIAEGVGLAQAGCTVGANSATGPAPNAPNSATAVAPIGQTVQLDGPELHQSAEQCNRSWRSKGTVRGTVRAGKDDAKSTPSDFGLDVQGHPQGPLTLRAREGRGTDAASRVAVPLSKPVVVPVFEKGR